MRNPEAGLCHDRRRAGALRLAEVIRPLVRTNGSGFRVQRIDSAVLGRAIDPWLSVDRFWMSGPVFPPHPHAGFSAITYVLPESPGVMRNRDSHGGRHMIRPGGLHWTAAGSGMMHEELPANEEMVEGLQIFLNHPSVHKHDAPFVQHLEPEDVPVIRQPDGTSVRVLAGKVGEIIAPVNLLSPVTVLDVSLAPFARFDWIPERQPASFAIVHSGEVLVTRAMADAGEVILPNGDGSLYLAATQAGARMTVFSGAPLQEPVYWLGPICMSTSQDAYRALARFQDGKMGTLAPYTGAD